jgi:zinc and cadmium transporter
MEQVIFFSLLGGLVSLIGGVILIRNEKTADGLAKYATPFAAGILLGAAFINLLPEAMHDTDAEAILTTALLGFLAFFILERFLRFFHHHHEHEAKNKASSSLIIIGDTLHNALDGIAIGAAFLISPSTGIIATIAVAAHEIPQEIGDFGLLLKNGMAKKKVILVNVFSALATTVTAVITFAVGDANSTAIPYLLAITAGFFIYIAASDIIPEIHDTIDNKSFDIRPLLLLIGALLVMIISPIAHDYIDAGHDDHSSSSSVHEDEENHSEEEVHNE